MYGGKNRVSKTDHDQRQGKGILGHLKDLWNWDPSKGAPTMEKYLATRAARHLWEITSHIPSEAREKERGRLARNLIKRVYTEDGDSKQAVEMWKLFNKRLPQQVTNKDYPKPEY